MSEKSQALLEAALALDPEDRRWLAEALWESFDEDEEVLKIADERWKALEENPDSWVSHDEVMKLLKRK
ncbi:addiction module protein [Luteolibacter soli]|uniref:Addiction module protein n=1 Tax=Luteolibacter soli TaxID=3135280 RepID=A0ABU9AVT4_9BACT